MYVSFICFFHLTDFISSILAVPVNGIVGDPQDILCLVVTTSVLDPSIVTSSWTGPNSVIAKDDRVKVNMTFDNNIYTTILHFDYLWESDEGVYTCNVTTSNHTVSPNTKLTNLLSKLLIMLIT